MNEPNLYLLQPTLVQAATGFGFFGQNQNLWPPAWTRLVTTSYLWSGSVGPTLVHLKTSLYLLRCSLLVDFVNWLREGVEIYVLCMGQNSSLYIGHRLITKNIVLIILEFDCWKK